MVGREIHTGRSLIVLRLRQHWSSHRHVHLLHAGRDGTTNAEISVVEKVLDRVSDGAVYRRHASRLPAADLESLQLSNRFRLVDWNARVHVLLLVQELFQSGLQKGELIDDNQSTFN